MSELFQLLFLPTTIFISPSVKPGSIAPFASIPMCVKAICNGSANGGRLSLLFTTMITPVGVKDDPMATPTIFDVSKPADVNTLFIWLAYWAISASWLYIYTTTLPLGIALNSAIKLCVCSGVMERGFCASSKSAARCIASLAFFWRSSARASAAASRSEARAVDSLAVAYTMYPNTNVRNKATKPRS